MPNRKRRCRQCKEYRPADQMLITPSNAAFCDDICAATYSKKQIPRERKREAKRQKREFYENDIKTRREAAVKWFNRFIRLRDAGKPCCSCGTTNPGIKYDAGHYIPAGSCSALRFDERNCHIQCSVQCNQHKSGNRVNYRLFLIREYGQEEVDRLEGPQPTINITVDWYREIEETYKAKCKELEARAA